LYPPMLLQWMDPMLTKWKEKAVSCSCPFPFSRDIKVEILAEYSLTF
jgi:hypothetical protein